MYSQLDSNVHEHLLSAITVLIDDNPAAIQQAKGMKNFNFKQILTQRINMIRDDPRFDVNFTLIFSSTTEEALGFYQLNLNHFINLFQRYVFL